MPSLADVLAVLHAVALTLFVGGTSVLMLTAILSRLRIRRPLLVWRTGERTCIPVGPSLFLLFVGVGIGFATLSGIEISPIVLIGYPAGGVFWFVATWLVQSTVITEYGLVPSLPCRHRAVAWSQVVDYAATSQNGQPHVVFVYRDRETGTHRRLDLPVPERCLDGFRDILSAKLDARRSFAGTSALDEFVVEQSNSRPDRE